jgi:hypothetical protein
MNDYGSSLDSIDDPLAIGVDLRLSLNKNYMLARFIYNQLLTIKVTESIKMISFNCENAIKSYFVQNGYKFQTK